MYNFFESYFLVVAVVVIFESVILTKAAVILYIKKYIYSIYVNLLCDGSFSVSVSHDPSEIIIICWFGAQETFIIIIIIIIIIINVENSCAA